MHSTTKTVTDADCPDPGRLSTFPCRKCASKDVWVQEISSSDHDDYRITCKACGWSYCEDGDDG